jgi:hypothetical protein
LFFLFLLAAFSSSQEVFVNRIATQAKQVLNLTKNKIVLKLADLRSLSGAENDDTVEAQAKTFRIWMWASALGLSLIVITSVASMTKHVEKSDESKTQTEVSILDQLPEGYVLAPIDPVNSDSLDSIFDQHGFADLYQAGPAGERGRRIARGLPLIRAPRNPKRFAVVVPEQQVGVLAELNEPVTVILRKSPSKATGADDTGKSKKRKRQSPAYKESNERIEIFEEDTLVSFETI